MNLVIVNQGGNDGISLASASRTGGLILKINGRDPAIGKTFKSNVDPTPITAIVNYLYTVGLGVAGQGVHCP